MPLSFETIEQDIYCPESGVLNESHEPGLIIVSQAEERDRLVNLINSGSMWQLRRLDYGQYFALAAFQGRKGSIGYEIQIDQISREGNTVNVYARLNEPEPNTNVGATVTSPYHVVKVQKTGEWDQEITFNLFSGNTLVASLVQAMP